MIFLGCSQLTMTSNFLGSTKIPSLETTCPRNTTLLSQNSYLENFAYSWWSPRFAKLSESGKHVLLYFLSTPRYHRWRWLQTSQGKGETPCSWGPRMQPVHSLVQKASLRTRNDHNESWMMSLVYQTSKSSIDNQTSNQSWRIRLLFEVDQTDHQFSTSGTCSWSWSYWVVYNLYIVT